jgi:hypothetical protein
LEDISERFSNILEKTYDKNKEVILEKVREKMDIYENINVPFYKMEEEVDYKNLYLKLKEYNASL